jgi:hypothetical protein
MAKDTRGGIQLGDFWKAVVAVAFLLFLVLFLLFPGDAKVFFAALKMLFVDFWWLILPIPLWQAYDMMWFEQVVGAWLGEKEYVYLELIPPKDIEKSPKIMEHVFAGVNDFSTPNMLEANCGWRILQPRMSWEIAGDEGRIHFYVRCVKQSKDNIESQIYAHYPDMEIIEVDDYTKQAPKNIPNAEWGVWGATLSLLKNDAVPIRTYKHFQEEVTGKMVDPLANMIEVMSKLPKGQHIWLQIILESEKVPNWHPASRAYIETVIREAMGEKGNGHKLPFSNFWAELKMIPGNVFSGFAGGELAGPASTEPEPLEFNINKLPPGTQELIKAISDNISKPGFKTVIRFIYFGTNDNFNKALGVAGIMGSLNTVAEINLNDLIPSALTKTFANYYFDQERLLRRQRKIVADFKSRDGSGMWSIFNTEELATLYHFPDMAIKNPSITRVESRREDAPANLPVGIEFE